MFICTDRQGLNFEFFVTLTDKVGPDDKSDLYYNGDSAWISPPSKAPISKTITVQMKSPRYLKTAVSYNFTRSTKEDRIKDSLDPFRKENVERIKNIYHEVCGRVKSRKQALRAQVNFTERNIVLQGIKPDPEMEKKARQTRALIRTKKSQVARQRNNEYVFEKVKTSLLQTYSHDLKLCREEEAYKQNYKHHLKLAVQGFWIHALFVYRFGHMITERVFQKRYSMLQDRLKRAKRLIAVKALRLCIDRHMVGKQERTLKETANVLSLVGTLYDHNSIFDRVRLTLADNFLNEGIILRIKLLDQFEDLITKSSMC